MTIRCECGQILDVKNNIVEKHDCGRREAAMEAELERANDWAGTFESTRGHYANKDHEQQKQIARLIHLCEAEKAWREDTYQMQGCMCWHEHKCPHKPVSDAKWADLQIALGEIKQNPNKITICKTCRGYGWAVQKD